MHVERNEFQAQTERGKVGPGPIGLGRLWGWPGRRGAAPVLPWASCGLRSLWEKGLGGSS